MSGQGFIDQPANHERILQNLTEPSAQRSAHQKVGEEHLPLGEVGVMLGKNSFGHKAFMNKLFNDRDHRLAHFSQDRRQVNRGVCSL